MTNDQGGHAGSNPADRSDQSDQTDQPERVPAQGDQSHGGQDHGKRAISSQSTQQSHPPLRQEACESGFPSYAELTGEDRSVCEAFVRSQYEGLFRHFQWLTNDSERAADLTQETLLQFWHSLRRTVPETTPRKWLYAVARNVWRKHCRHRQRRRSHESEMPDETLGDQFGSREVGPDDRVEQREFVDDLVEAVAQLPEDYREVFALRVWQEMDYEQIAALQEIKPGLARWRFFEARRRIRATLKSWEQS